MPEQVLRGPPLPTVPARVANAARAASAYPVEYAALLPALSREDRLADELVAWADTHGQRPTDVFDSALALQRRGEQHASAAANALVAQMLRKPAWLDEERLRVGVQP